MQTEDFNPRSHKGSDNLIWPLGHIPGDFNPRSHKGSDVFTTQLYGSITKFQSTLPQGERPANGVNSLQFLKHFNPRSHKGSDVIMHCLSPNLVDFNPRSHKGSDGFSRFFHVLDCLFQSTLPQGERHVRNVVLTLIQVFQSTLPQGERHLLPLRYLRYDIHFNPRSHKGSDATVFSDLIL